MPTVIFTPNLRRHLDAPPVDVSATTVAEVFEQVFLRQPALRGYLLDDQGRLRPHVAVFVDGRRVQDPEALTDAVAPASEVYVIQALSGGRA